MCLLGDTAGWFNLYVVFVLSFLQGFRHHINRFQYYSHFQKIIVAQLLIFSYCLFWAKTSPLHYFLFIYSCHVQLRTFELVTLISFNPAVLQITFISDFSLDPHHTFDPCSDRTTPVILDVKVRFIHVVDM